LVSASSTCACRATAPSTREFNVSVAEVEDQDLWQRAVLGVACVSSSAGYAHGQLERVVQWIEAQRFDVELLDYQIELL
jgi:uncharacterized protein YlxP (DUF503 family)